jgi:hypothetical protein
MAVPSTSVQRENPLLDTSHARDSGPRPRHGPAADTAPRHLAAAPVDGRDGPLWHKRTPPDRRKGWQWLLVLPGIAPLLTPLYNRLEPTLWGIPFFYWYQMACGLFSVATITFVYQITKGRRS